MRGRSISLLSLALLFAAAPAAGAQDAPASNPATQQLTPGAAAAQASGGGGGGGADIIMPHITDARYVYYPCYHRENGETHLECKLKLPQWEPLHIGGLTIDLSPTKHVVMMLIASLLLIAIMWWAARDHARDHASGKAPRGAANAIEAMKIGRAHV